ncbi:MAG TPA: hypothetical protein VMK65_13600 [Longimicrobiales bacterium]|nr:hypothetical protein [Longimicrobiales bacterium]
MPEPSSSGDADARVAPTLPLTLLETVRSRDLPPEILEGEDLPASLPRRLGLSDVVARQIVRFKDAKRRGERIPAQEVKDLLRLVLRRPDAPDVLRETGRQLARQYFGRVAAPARVALRILPRRAVLLAARRATRKLLRPVAGGSVEDGRRPVLARVHGPVTVVDDSPTGCVLFSGALEELVTLYTHATATVSHSTCESRGDAYCEWILVEGT